MNQSLLPLSVSSPSPAKPVSPINMASNQPREQDSFAEHLSRTQQERSAQQKPISRPAKRDDKLDSDSKHAKSEVDNTKSKTLSKSHDQHMARVKEPTSTVETTTAQDGHEVENPEVLEILENGVLLSSDINVIDESDLETLPLTEKSIHEIEVDESSEPILLTSLVNQTHAQDVEDSETLEQHTDLNPSFSILATSLPQTNLDSQSNIQIHTSELFSNTNLEIVPENLESGLFQKTLDTTTKLLEENSDLTDLIVTQAANPKSLDATKLTSPTQTEFTKLVPTGFVQSTTQFQLKSEGGIELPSGVSAENSALSLDLNLKFEPAEKDTEKFVKTDLFKSLLSSIPSEPTEKQGTSILPTALGAQLATTNRIFVPQTQLGMNMMHPNWGNAVGEKVLWMANQQLTSADIRLDPPELGSLHVKVSMHMDQTSITFVSPHPQVRELLDQQVTRLREMFMEQGLQLGQVDVSDRRQGQDTSDEKNDTKSRSLFSDEPAEDVVVSSVSSLYLIDQFV